jgi:mono/diheme cytochrome c family protein
MAPPRWMIFAGVLAVAASLIPIALIARARAVKSDQPRVQLERNMARQPKFKTQTENPLFADSRAMRPPVEGVLSHGAGAEDEARELGQVKGQWITGLPLPVSLALIKRGQERFDIYCSPCHGLAGYGDGLVARRADQLQEGTWTPPSSLHSDQVRNQPDGRIFNTITNGIRSMPAHGPQIPRDDRWAIVGYVRALERSQNAQPLDLPPERRPGAR